MSRAQGCAGATTLKTPYRDGTTHIILEPLDFIARLAALVPKLRVNLTRFHGVFAPNSTLRHHVTPADRGKRKPIEAKTPAQRRTAMTWAQRLKRVFKIDIETCDQCGGTVKVIACIEDPAIVEANPGSPRATDRSQHNIHAPRPSAPAGGSARRILISSSQGRNARTAPHGPARAPTRVSSTDPRSSPARRPFGHEFVPHTPDLPPTPHPASAF